MPEAYWISGPWPGRLAIIPRPRGGDWLEVDAHNLRKAGIQIVASFLEPAEEKELELLIERRAIESSGLDFRSFPIPDRGVPRSREAFEEFVHQLQVALAGGKTVALHCRQGIGRSGLTAAALLVDAGLSLTSAFETVEKGRGRPVPDTPEQRRWLEIALKATPGPAQQKR